MAKQQSDPPACSASSKAAGGEAFPTVGIGASAGGLEALEQFLAKVPAASGIAYVIVQHLDQTHNGMMPDLLCTGISPIHLVSIEVNCRTSRTTRLLGSLGKAGRFARSDSVELPLRPVGEGEERKTTFREFVDAYWV